MARKRSRAAVGALLTCFSVASASEVLQHRVRSANREVDYQHVVEERPRGHHRKFWIPSARGSRNRGSRRLERNSESSADLRESISGHHRVWDLNVQGGTVDASPVATKAESGGYFRRLYEQFIGQDDSYNASDTNVTAEVSNFTGNETSVYTTNENSNSTFNESAAEELIFQPLRIRAILDEVEGNGDMLTDLERETLFHDILKPALLSWSNALRVDPVIGNLTVDVEQLVDGATCGPGMDSGLPSARVPVEHLTVGVPETDVLVYLNLDFVAPRRTNLTNTTSSLLEEEDSLEVPNTSVDGEARRRLDSSDFWSKISKVSDQMSGSRGSTNGTSHWENTAAADGNSTGTCNGEYLAAASFCSTDQYDRPTAALLHICIDETFFEPAQRHRNILTLMHELGHALGFNSVSMAHFRRTDGTPYTERIDGDVPDVLVECSGPQSERRQAMVPLPSEEILQFREVRGGVRVAEIVTPSVLQVVRNQFNCQDLTGAELESGEGLILSAEEDGFGCLGDHWERRLFSSDLLNPVVDDLEYYPRISTLTLAYFADSGWYQVDLSGSRVASGWGRGAGCGFVNETCIGQDGEVPPQNVPFFCNDISNTEALSTATDISGCTSDLSRKATCSMGRYGLELPWEYQYFQDTYGSDVGGNDRFMDYCPVFLGYDNGLCSSLESQENMQASELERFGARNSRCLLGSLNPLAGHTALCLPIACVVEDRSLRIKVGKEWHRCSEANEKIVEGEITIECPDPRRVCPTFYCPYDCLGTGGQCDYMTGQCMCEFAGDGEEELSLRDCSEKKKVAPSGMSSPVFLRPVEPTELDPAVPHPDSPLSDYYVPTERELDGGNDFFLPLWAWTIVGGGVVIMAATFGYRRWTKRTESLSSWFRQDVVESQVQSSSEMSRNKDKMVATVLVDLRMTSNALARESIAETDEQLTESEASQAAPSEALSDVSSQAEAEPDATETTESPQPVTVMRRRRTGM